MKNIPHPDNNGRKLHPWLRIVRNGDRVVNAVRSDASTRVACTAPLREKGVQAAPVHQLLAQQSSDVPRLSEHVQASSGKLPKRSKLRQRDEAEDAFVNVFIEFFPEPQGSTGGPGKEMERVMKMIEDRQPASAGKIPGAAVTRRNFLCATVPIPMLDELDRDPAIAFVHPSEPLKLDRPEVTSVSRDKKVPSKAIGSAKKYGRGEAVLIGIIDVGGFDFAHPDFLDEKGKTRFVAIWDQGGDFRDPPQRFPYGSEFRQDQLNAAIAAAKPGLPPASWIERQSQLQPGSHGTHVASIAAGNSGVCPKAKIAAVLIDVPTIADDVARRRATFSDSSRITHAVEYLLGIAEELKLPIAINISLGTNGGSHDGSGGVSRWLDAYLATPGRAICVAAGNAGQEKSQDQGDLGWIMGRIHTSGQIPARGLEAELEWTVVGDGLEDFSENELEIWYGAQDRFTVSVKPPDAAHWIVVKPQEYVENRRLTDGVTVSIYNELYYPTNGSNYIAIYLSPNLDPVYFRGVTRGIWRVRLQGEDIRDGHFDAWIERDDPMEIGREGGRRMFLFPSFFTEKSYVDSHSITSLACGFRVIAVANLDEARQRINVSSSQGPTRDGRCKPEIAAPGTNITAANGFSGEERWITMSGTSMATPYVTGVVGLMLAANPSLTSAQCQGILQRTARPLPGASYKWANDLGFGVIHPAAAIEEARTFDARLELR
jgi:subtilisin family serine protease